jgi:hypothetical protein
MADAGLSRLPLAFADAVRAQSAIVSAAWKLRTVRIGDLVSRKNPMATQSASAPAGPRRGRPPARAWELALAVKRAARFGILRPQCLVRSLALQQLLNSEGIGGSVICVGVRREKGQSALLAHAWVEVDGSVVGDQSDYVNTFARLEGLRVGAEQ